MLYSGVLAIILGSGVWWLVSEWLNNRSFSYLDYYTGYNLESGPGLSSVVFQAQGITGFLLRVLYALVSPIPFVGVRFEEQFQGSLTLVHYMFLPFLVLGALAIAKGRTGSGLLLAFALFFLMTLITFTFRHTVVFFPYAALIAAIGFAEYRHYKQVIWGTTATTFCGGAIIYVLLKGGL
jgi:hypothetical protein